MYIKSLKVLFLYAFINLIVHVFFINLPPCGSHVWRQCNTLGMSRNFATESMDILHPRIDRRNSSDGITGSHFPAYEWTLAMLSKVFGFSDLLSRIFSLFVFTIGMLAFYLFLKQIDFDFKYSLIGPLILLSIPQNYYDSMNAMPDLLALTLSLLSLYYLTIYFKKEQLLFMGIGLVLAAAAGLIKFQFLIIPLSSIVYIRLTKNNLVAIVLGAAIVISVVFLWYFYAIELTKLNNLREFGLWIKSITFEEKIKTIKSNLISDFPELIFGWPLFILFLFLLKKIGFKGQIKHQIIIGFLGFLVFYMIAIERMQHHSYYFIALLPFLVLSILNSYRASGLKFNLLILICGLNFIWSFTRIVPSRWADGGKGIPEEFKNTAQRNLLTKEMKSSKISLVGPDVSGCVFFYFTNTKGYSINKFDELFKERKHGSELNAMLESGLDKILIYKTDSTDRLMASIKAKKLIDRVGDFEIWEINRKK
jgi:hypothetical protein